MKGTNSICDYHVRLTDDSPELEFMTGLQNKICSYRQPSLLVTNEHIRICRLTFYQQTISNKHLKLTNVDNFFRQPNPWHSQRDFRQPVSVC